MKRFLTVTATASMILVSTAFSDPASPTGLRLSKPRKTIIREIPVEFRSPTDMDLTSATRWLLDEVAIARAECVKVLPSKPSTIKGVFCEEDLEEMLEELTGP